MDSIEVAGLVEQPGRIDRALLDDVPQMDMVADFVCLEGWTDPDRHWRGYRLSDLLAPFGVRPQATHLQVGHKAFVAVLPLPQALEEGLVAVELNGRELACRFVLPGAPCYQHVKDIDRLELSDHSDGETAQDIALRRIAKNKAGDAGGRGRRDRRNGNSSG